MQRGCTEVQRGCNKVQRKRNKVNKRICLVAVEKAHRMKITSATPSFIRLSRGACSDALSRQRAVPWGLKQNADGSTNSSSQAMANPLLLA